MENDKIAIFGLGRVGMPLGLVLADKGFKVTGIDVDAYRVTLIKNKILPFLEEGAEPLLKKYGGKEFQVYSQEHVHRILRENKTIIITLGTPIDDTYSPDFKQIEDLFIRIAPSISKGHLIILRSTISPGTTEYLGRLIEKLTKLKVGSSIFLAYCPERIAEGKAVQELVEIPQIISGLDDKSVQMAAKIFSRLTKKILFATPKEAELAKLFCNMYRYINFAIGNEFMMISENYGCDYYKVLDLVNRDYKRSGLKPAGFTAGPCLVKDGFFLIDKSPYMELVTAAWRLNENLPGYLFDKIKKQFKSLTGKKVAVLGLAFKKNIDDLRYSLAPKMVRYFNAEGAKVSVHDPFIDSQPIEEALTDADILVIGVNHDRFNVLNHEKLAKHIKKDCLICDVWNMFGTNKIIFHLSQLKDSQEIKK